MEVQNADIYRQLLRKFDRVHKEDISDAMAHSTMVILERSPELQPIENPEAYRLVIARRELSKTRNKSKSMVYPDTDEKFTWDHVDECVLDHPEVQHINNTSDVNHILLGVPEMYAEVLRLFYLEGRTFESIAKQLDLNPACIRKRHQRALEYARRKFSDPNETAFG